MRTALVSADGKCSIRTPEVILAFQIARYIISHSMRRDSLHSSILEKLFVPSALCLPVTAVIFKSAVQIE